VQHAAECLLQERQVFSNSYPLHVRLTEGDELQLKESAVYGALAASTHDAVDGMTPNEIQRHRDLALIGFGGIAGVMMQQEAGISCNAPIT